MERGAERREKREMEGKEGDRQTDKEKQITAKNNKMEKKGKGVYKTIREVEKGEKNRKGGKRGRRDK